MAELDGQKLAQLSSRFSELDEKLKRLKKDSDDLSNSISGMSQKQAEKAIRQLTKGYEQLENKAKGAISEITTAQQGAASKTKIHLRELKREFKDFLNLVNSAKVNIPSFSTGGGGAASTDAGKRYEETLKNIGEQQTTNNGILTEHNKELGNTFKSLQRIGAAFGVAFSLQGLVQFGRKLIETRGEFEMQQVALRSILQNKQLADEIWDKTMQAALMSPFTAMQLTRYTKQLAAYRIETEKL